MRAPSFGRWVRQARSSLDLTQEVLAERVGCAVQTIRKIEAGERRPSQQMAERLARALALPPAEHAEFLKAARVPVAQLPVDPTAHSPDPQRIHIPTIPITHTPFIGRVAELAEVRRLLADWHYRLVTLVGPGGIGKTRLAIEAAKKCPVFADGVVFVPLAPISSAALLVPTIADAVGFTFSGPEAPAIQLLRYLQTKELLLILDNLEHVLGEAQGAVLAQPDAASGTVAGFLAQILDQTPRVKLLVTSRERVSLGGEWTLRLAGLPVWQSDEFADPPDADAVILFVERARQVQHDFQLTAADRPVVMQICRLLEGMPLGIELAATWVRALSCVEIAAELERGLDFLQTSTRDLPARHRSMRAVFEHSWQLLHTEEQRVLRRLAVFRGGFTRAAAEEVAGATLSLLAALIDKSLVRRSAAERYDLHEVVRQGAASHLEHDPQEERATRDRHAGYFAALLADRERLLKSPAQRATVAELSAEIDNVRAAWHWAARRRRLSDLRKAIPTLYYFYEVRSWYQEAGDLFRQAADVLQSPSEMEPGAEDEERIVLGELLALQGWFAFRYSEFERARELAERSLALLGPQTTAAALAEALPWLWTVRYNGGDYDQAAALLRLRIQLQRARGDRFAEAGALLHLGTLRQQQGEQQEAYRLVLESLVLFRAMGDPVMIARALAFAAGTAHAIGDHDEAQRLARESLSISRDIEDRFSMQLALQALGRVALNESRYGEARALLEESHALALQLGYRWGIAAVLNSLGQTLHALGALTEAHQAFLEALGAAQEAQTVTDMLEAMLGLAAVLYDLGTTEQAMSLSLHILGHPAASQPLRAQAERLRSKLEEALSRRETTVVEERVRGETFEVIVAELVAGQSST